MADPALAHVLREWKYCPRCAGALHRYDLKAVRCGTCQFTQYPFQYVGTSVFVLCNQHLLVIERGMDPHKGMLDVPGGFAEEHEWCEAAAWRELGEETDLVATGSLELFAAIPDTYPDLAHPVQGLFYLLEVPEMVPVIAKDDACNAQWMRLDRVDPQLFGFESVRQALRQVQRAKT